MTDGTTHTFATVLRWSGSTAVGYEAYDRSHQLTAGTVETPLAMSADPAFRGDANRLNPEQLLVAAASSCQLLSFLAVAARARLDLVAYEDDATAVMPEDDPPMRITRIDLHPVMTLAAPPADRPDESRLAHLVDVAHRQCFIANSLTTDVVVHPDFRWIDSLART